MKINVLTTPVFDKKYKKYRKKFPSIKAEVEAVQESLLANPKQGTDLGDNIYKIRMASKSKGKGKSGGFRIVTYVLEETEEETNVHLLIIYDKSENNNILKFQLLQIIKDFIAFLFF